MRPLKYLAATGMVLATMQANAALLDSIGGINTPIVGNDNFFEGSVGKNSYDIGANLYFGGHAPSIANLTFTFLGKEASYNTVFSAYGAGSLSNSGSVFGDSFSVNNVDTSLNGGLVDFDFDVVAPVIGGIANGFNAFPEANKQSFAVILDTTFNGVWYDALLMWDDAGGPNADDDNHDDQVIGLKISSVPEPGTIALMGLGLLGLGISRRRSK